MFQMFFINLFETQTKQGDGKYYPLSSAIMLKLSFQIFTTNNLQHSRLQSSAESLPRCPVLSFLVCLLLMGFFFFFSIWIRRSCFHEVPFIGWFVSRLHEKNT